MCDTCATMDAMTDPSVVNDILILARHCQDKDCGAASAAKRVLAAHAHGGLPRAVAGQILAGAERRLTAALQGEIEVLVREGG